MGRSKKQYRRRPIDPSSSQRYKAILTAFLFLQHSGKWVRAYELYRASPWTFNRMLKSPDKNGRWLACMCTHLSRWGFLERRVVKREKPARILDRRCATDEGLSYEYTEYALAEAGAWWLLSNASYEHMPSQYEVRTQYSEVRVKDPGARDRVFRAVANLPAVSYGWTLRTDGAA